MLGTLLLLLSGATLALCWPSERPPWDGDAKGLGAVYLVAPPATARLPWPKRALSLFAHWRPQQYNPGGDEPELPSDFVGRPHGLPLRWG